MNTVGFPITHKENEKRRALIPEHLKNIQNCNCLYFEEGYGKILDISDDEYKSYGCHIASHDEVLKKDIICDPKIGDADYLENKLNNQTIFGWIHAVQNADITDKLIKSSLTAFAWEDMFDTGRHTFWRNNELAGEAAIMHAFECYGTMPYCAKVALLGRGNVASGALKILTMLGADVTVYSKRTEALFKEEVAQYDVVVNAVLWDTSREDHIVSRQDLSKMKKHSLIIDISCDRNGGIETSIPTTIENPIYVYDGIYHYVVDHTPSIFYKTATEGISVQVSKYIDYLITGEFNEVLNKAKIFDAGVIIDNKIKSFQGR